MNVQEETFCVITLTSDEAKELYEELATLNTDNTPLLENIQDELAAWT